jgi:hypothetical protein
MLILALITAAQKRTPSVIPLRCQALKTFGAVSILIFMLQLPPPSKKPFLKANENLDVELPMSHVRSLVESLASR